MSRQRNTIVIVGEPSDADRLQGLLKPFIAAAAYEVQRSWQSLTHGQPPAAIFLAGESGRSQLGQIIERTPTATIVVVDVDSAAIAAHCLRRGVSEYLCWQTLETHSANSSLLQSLVSHSEAQPVLQSAAVSRVYRLARRVAPSDVPVLIHGVSGSGKEVLARFIHERSLRTNGPFVAVNCAAIPENMLEATLFGHEKGAFTGADRRREGKFQSAREGTLLLDEVTEMPIELQAKLLRAIQEREVEPLGAKSAVATNVRIIATSNRDLKQAISDGRLRLDLYYRLNVFPLQLPSLQQRCEDILPLAELFVERHHRSHMAQTGDTVFSERARAVMLAHDWPGNVRELENRVQRALILAEHAEITPADLGLGTDQPADAHRSGDNSRHSDASLVADAATVEVGNDFKSQLQSQESALILQALKRNGGQRKATAAALGMSERTLRYRLSRMREIGVSVS